MNRRRERSLGRLPFGSVRFVPTLYMSESVHTQLVNTLKVISIPSQELRKMQQRIVLARERSSLHPLEEEAMSRSSKLSEATSKNRKATLTLTFDISSLSTMPEVGSGLVTKAEINAGGSIPSDALSHIRAFSALPHARSVLLPLCVEQTPLFEVVILSLKTSHVGAKYLKTLTTRTVKYRAGVRRHCPGEGEHDAYACTCCAMQPKRGERRRLSERLSDAFSSKEHHLPKQPIGNGSFSCAQFWFDRLLVSPCVTYLTSKEACTVR